jgi:hypothetical protein
MLMISAAGVAVSAGTVVMETVKKTADLEV